MGDGSFLDLNEKQDTQYCIPLTLRDEQIRINSRLVSQRLHPEDVKTDPIAIVGYAPSLKKTWKELKKFKYIISCSGAGKFLLSKGVVPTYHLDVDPRIHKVELLGTPDKRVKYLPASAVHPTYIKTLLNADCDVTLWHIFARDGESDQVIPRGEWAITGGSDAGMRCMSVAHVLGFRNFHIFGLDGSDAPSGRHAGKHPNQAKGQFTTECNGRTFKTTPALMQCAKQVFHELEQLPDVTFQFYGDGLIQEIAKTYEYKPNGNGIVAIKAPELISKNMVALNKKLHEDVPTYGMGGSKYADAVLKMKTDEIQSVLDYGCGKGTLAKSLPFPIWEYDPAITGKDELPKPADLVICTDVLEHIEPDMLNAVLDDLKRVTLQVGYFVIHCGAAQKTYADGRNAHLIQQDGHWWTKQLKKRFSIAQVIQNGAELHVIVAPKKDYEDPIIAIKAKHGKVRFYTPNDVTEWRAESLLIKEPVTIKWLDSMQAGDILFDIGANVGGYTCYAGTRGIKVFAFEPEADNYSLLVRNIRLNDIDATAYCVALSDKMGLNELHLSQKGAGGSCHSFGESKDFNGNERASLVRQGCLGMPLDSLDLPRPTHIKIDVDGFEHLVIQGGLETVKQAQSLLIEINPSIEAHNQLKDDLLDLGFVFDEKQVNDSTRKSGAFKGVAEYVFYRVSAVEQHLVKQIEQATLIHEPYPHLYIENAFPQEYYDAILSDEIEYKPISEVRNTNYPDRFVGMKDFTELTRGTVGKALCEKFNVGNGTHEETLLIKDKAGYAISPHTDLQARVLSAIFYLAKDSKHPELGTTVYVPKKKGFMSNGSKHLPFKNFNKVKTLPYKPNSAFIFLRTDNSFHGVEKTKHERNVLLYDIRK